MAYGQTCHYTIVRFASVCTSTITIYRVIYSYLPFFSRLPPRPCIIRRFWDTLIIIIIIIIETNDGYWLGTTRGADAVRCFEVFDYNRCDTQLLLLKRIFATCGRVGRKELDRVELKKKK